MKLIHLFSLLGILSLIGCATLDQTEIANRSVGYFEPLQLEPEFDLYHFRVDIIRQTEDKMESDSTTSTEAVNYHILGFALGNGLFYDLNGSLGFDVLKLLAVNTESDFELQKTYFPNQKALRLIVKDGFYCYTNKPF